MEGGFMLRVVGIAVAVILFMPCFDYVYGDACDVEGRGLRIYISGTKDSWSFIWSLKGIERQKTTSSIVDSEGRLNMASGASNKRSESLPQNLVGPDLRLDVPFAASRGRGMLIASVHRNFMALELSRKIALIDVKGNRLLHVIETKDYVRSLAWSPSDKYFAVLYSRDVTSQKWKGPLDWISKFLGHPVSYYTMYVAIYSSDGKLVCERVLIEKLAHGRGYIEWEGP